MALANIITHANFTGILYLDVAGTKEVPVARQKTLKDIITEFQQKIFRDLVGEALYQYLTDNEEEDVYTVLRDGVRITDDDGYKYEYRGLKTMLASFVYYYYKIRIESFDTGSGEKKSSNENSTPANTGLNRKIIEAWNKGVDLYLDAISYINYKNDEETDYYPEFLPDYRNYANFMNHVGI